MKPDTPNAEQLGQAADWLLRQQEGGWGIEQQRQFDAWRSQNPAHEQAWKKAERLQSMLGHRLAGKTLANLPKPRRRAVIAALLLAPVGWALWQQQHTNLHIAIGEQRQITLADGTRIWLNSDSEAALDETIPQLTLISGEILVETAASARKLLVTTEHGTLRPIGTRFNVRLHSGQTQLAVSDGLVEICTISGETSRIAAGQQTQFDRQRIASAQAISAGAMLWQQGMLLVENQPLQQVVNELARYRRGVVRCHPDIAQLKVSGAFSIRDTDAALALLARSHRLTLTQFTPYWVNLSRSDT